MKLSDGQNVILSRAMNRPTQDVEADPKAQPQGFAAAVRGLLVKGLLNRVAAKTDIDGSYVQKTDEGSFSFVVNTNAYAALNAEPDDTVTVPKPGKGVPKITAEAESEEDEEDKDDGVPKSGVMALKYHERYMAQEGGCMDDVDQQMRDAFNEEVVETYQTKKGETKQRKVTRVNTAALREFMEELELWNESWENLNPGMQRMNSANRIRGAIRNGRIVRLNNRTLTTPMPEPKEKTPKQKATAKKEIKRGAKK